MRYLSRRQRKTTKKNVNFNSKSNVLFEDTHIHGKNGASFKIINDKDKPFYQYNYKEMK